MIHCYTNVPVGLYPTSVYGIFMISKISGPAFFFFFFNSGRKGKRGRGEGELLFFPMVNFFSLKNSNSFKILLLLTDEVTLRSILLLEWLPWVFFRRFD